jgi:V/A-type H+-transporting ATPase subunit A
MAGGAGSGKTFMLRALAKGCSADVIVYVGCGGRGSEAAEMLEEFSRTERQGAPLMERTVFVVTTSNMPAAAREPCIYVGMTLAEYYRDMGCDVVLMVDSMSRWAEASREIESCLEGPGEEGACLESRLAGCCERAGQVALGASSRRGSVSLINVFSPGGGDFSDPVTQAGLSSAGACWRLDKALAQARRFPAVDLARSYSLYDEGVSDALAQDAGQDWPELKEYLRATLLRERELSDSTRSAAGLSQEDRWILFHAETLKIVYLQQNALVEDALTPLASAAAMLRLLQALDGKVRKFLREGLRCDDVTGVSMRPELTALWLSADFTEKGQKWLELLDAALAAKLAAQHPTGREAAQ